MAKKNRMYAPSTTKKDPFYVGTIDSEQIRKMEQAGRRLKRIALETRSGGGVHGEPDKKSKHRADRRDGKRAARNWKEI